MITETLKRTVKKTRVSERGKIFEHVYRQLIPSRKGRQSNGQFRNLVDGFNPEARTLISYVSLGLKEHGLDNHADRLMQHYGFSEEVALDVLSPTMKNKSEYYTMIMSSVGKLQEEVHAIFSDGQDRDYTVKDLLEASARNNAGVSGPCVYVYQGEPLDKVIPRIEALMLGSKGKTIPDKMRADYERLNHILNEDGHSGMSTTDALHFLLVQEIGRFYIHRIDDDGRKSLRKAGNVRDGLEDVYGDNVMQRVHGIHPLLAEVMNNLDNVANELEETVFVSTSYRPQLTSKFLVRPKSTVYLNGISPGIEEEIDVLKEELAKQGLKSMSYTNTRQYKNVSLCGDVMTQRVAREVEGSDVHIEIVGDGFGDTSYKLAKTAVDTAKAKGVPSLILVKKDRKANHPEFAEQFLAEQSDIQHITYESADELPDLVRDELAKYNSEVSSTSGNYMPVVIEGISSRNNIRKLTSEVVNTFDHYGKIRNDEDVQIVPFEKKSAGSVEDIFATSPLYVAVVNNPSQMDITYLEAIHEEYQPFKGESAFVVLCRDNGTDDSPKLQEILPDALVVPVRGGDSMCQKSEEAFKSIFEGRVPNRVKEDMWKTARETVVNSYRAMKN